MIPGGLLNTQASCDSMATRSQTHLKTMLEPFSKTFSGFKALANVLFLRISRQVVTFTAIANCQHLRRHVCAWRHLLKDLWVIRVNVFYLFSSPLSFLTRFWEKRKQKKCDSQTFWCYSNSREKLRLWSCNCLARNLADLIKKICLFLVSFVFSSAEKNENARLEM